MSSDTQENAENICVVCFKNVNIFSIGSCDHMVCYECSTRMRVLCRQNDCPICRQDLPRVIFTATIKPFNEIQNCSSLEDKKFKICFQNKKIQEAFYKLLEHRCSVCPNGPTFKTFQYLYDHMKKDHDLYYCDLCVEHLKIFTSERQCYTQKNLEQHKKKGDVDDRSHRGHPLCQFCDVRYMDNDCLYRHLRRDHLYCHFCDADGFDLYYSSYDYLLEHFRTEHYLCEEGSCVDEKFTPVFRTDIDLKAHRASAHGKTLGKAAAKQARTLELEFTLKPRPRHQETLRKGKPRPSEASTSEGAAEGEQASGQGNLPKLDSSDFPSLPSGPGSSVPTLIPQQRSGLTIHAVGRRNTPLAINDENFPVLGVYNDLSMPGTSVRLNINQDRNASGSSKNRTSRNLSIHVNHKPNGEQNIRIRQDTSPAINLEKKTQPTASNWAVISSKKPAAAAATAAASNSTKKPQKLLLDNDFPSLHSKFSTNLNLKLNEPSKPNFVNIKKYKESQINESKRQKASSLTIPVQNEVPEMNESSSSSVKVKSKKKKSKSNNVDEKSDTAKKKSSKDVEKKEESEDYNKSPKLSALNSASSDETTTGKPLPKVEDWFETLKKGPGRSQSEKSNESVKVSSNSTKVSLKKPLMTNSSSSSSNNSSCSTSNSTSNNNNNSTNNNHNNNSNNNNNNNNNNNYKNGNKNSHSNFSLNTETKESSIKPEVKAPPGFDNLSSNFNNEVKKPPPGFSVNFPRSNCLTFTNSSGQSYAISTNFQYVPPVNFEKRNQHLVSKVNKILVNDADLEEFRKMSLLFRQDLLSAKSYYEHCIKAMGDGLKDVFPELLVLLPDISKQQELFQVYSQNQNFLQSSKNLESCITCQQVLSKGDVKEHLAQHSMQQNFPVLIPDQSSK